MILNDPPGTHILTPLGLNSAQWDRPGCAKHIPASLLDLLGWSQYPKVSLGLKWDMDSRRGLALIPGPALQM
ncbi:hypothetical protein BTVI_97836 [Pitangus sulphuratus]|nr:hypothetical protein BTVI_97836 [Pitangus sulphuratus]